MTHTEKSFWRFAVLCSRENGLRLGDIASLKWACFTEEAHSITVWTDKTNKRLVHKMSPTLEAALGDIISTDTDYLFPEQHVLVMDVKKRGLLSVKFTRMCERLGITGKSFHNLRHRREKVEDINSMAKKLAKSLSLEDMRKLLGHSSSKTTNGYLHE
jgi:integrase